MLTEFKAVGYQSSYLRVPSIFVMKLKSQRSLNDLRDKATIALHADFKLDEVSPTIKATEICQNVRCTFLVQRSGLELASSVNLQNNS